jgi:serine/threonine-protein kinase RsbW
LSPTPSSYRPSALLHVDIVATQPSLNRLLDAFDRFARMNKVPVSLRREAHLVIDEVVANVIAHGGRAPRQARVEVSVGVDGRAMKISIADDGRPFNPLVAGKPDLAGRVTDRRVGGLGIHLVRNLMDRVEYRRRDGRNELRLTRYVARERKAPEKRSDGQAVQRGGR